MDPDQTAPRGAVWSGSTLFATMTFKVTGRRQSRRQLLCLAPSGLRQFSLCIPRSAGWSKSSLGTPHQVYFLILQFRWSLMGNGQRVEVYSVKENHDDEIYFAFFFFPFFSISHSNVMHMEICVKDFSGTTTPMIEIWYKHRVWLVVFVRERISILMLNIPFICPFFVAPALAHRCDIGVPWPICSSVRQQLTCERNSSYSFWPIILKLHRCFGHGV